MEMSAEQKGADSSDSECFIVKEIKPVKRPLVQKTLTLKSTTESNGLNSKRNKSNKKKDKVRRASTDLDDAKSKKKQTTSEVGAFTKNIFSSSANGLNRSNSAPLSISKDVCCENVTNNSSRLLGSPNTRTPKIGQTKGFSENESSINTDKIQVSPGISRKRKKFVINEVTSKPVSPKKKVRKPLLKMFDAVDKGTNTIAVNESNTGISLDKTSSISDRITENSELLCFLVKEMIKDEMKKHSSLFSEREIEILDKFFTLQESACRVFVRMLGRKKSWHRVCDIIYKDISDNLENEFEVLHRENYVDMNIYNQDLKIQIELLKKPEVKNLCKVFKVSSKFSDSNKKEDFIHSLIQECRKQKSVAEMLTGGNSTTRVDRLKSEVKKYLGKCIRLNNETFHVFYKALLLASFPHYYNEEDQRFKNELLTRSQVYKNQIKFPTYNLSSVEVFESREVFEEYQKAVLLLDSFNIAVVNKDYDEFVSVHSKAKAEFERLMKNDEYQKYCLSLKPFLRKFTAGAVYARILTNYLASFKKKVDNSEVRNTAELLLNQNLFLTRKKGEWYEVLSKTYKNEKQSNAAAEVLIKGLRDPNISEVQKLMLQLKGQLILKVKTNVISDASTREVLNELCVSSVPEPDNVEIKGKPLEDNKAGFKCVFVEESKNGRRYVSVEERAISYYKSNGFTKGYHTEGLIIQSIYFLIFFDIIYGMSPEGAFLSPYQEAPLDFNSSMFYENRKEEIDILLSDMSSWDDQELEAKIRDSYTRNYGTTCLIKWSDEFTADLFCEVAKCITVPILVLIFQRFVRNFRQVRAGFPDLTLWNPETSKCKFVEVKSSTDRLSPGQRVWLNYLKNIGLDCEVCNVINASGKNCN